MARVEVTRCDVCGCRCGDYEEPDHVLVGVIVDRRLDAAGSVDDIQETVDFCSECCGRELSRLIGRWPIPLRAEWIAGVRANCERRRDGD